ncbi:Oidioi.mRNA.OKI2018_I69.XSR.g15902.t2.cds [Oikopleura dioica]|uniref:Oidioi.mRNA.OKI2018_I69.XSR.g15902.t2.cds n=1 Tax=Oikopleura dioica TaxID=34765 RepID=A0ABN7SG91_OIKDI|nr:Oidioi.mRNA.OKI2018_I69.XSR.g15902.t2.cds [Oikopleura dioica]
MDDGETFVWKFDNFIDAALVSVLEVKAENAVNANGSESQVIANIVKVSDYNPSGYLFWLPRDKRFVKISSLRQKWIVRRGVCSKPNEKRQGFRELRVKTTTSKDIRFISLVLGIYRESI